MKKINDMLKTKLLDGSVYNQLGDGSGSNFPLPASETAKKSIVRNVVRKAAGKGDPMGASLAIRRARSRLSR